MNKKSNIFILFIGYTILFPLATSCNNHDYTAINGSALGTYYNIRYDGKENYQTEIDSFFIEYNKAANTYVESSEISKFNSEGEVIFESTFLPEMLELYKHFYQKTNHALNPAMMPLIKAWGFGSSERISLTQHQIDSLLELTSMENLIWNEKKLYSTKKGVMLDFSSIGEGFAIDILSDFLEEQNIKNYMVEIGGEMRCKGVNPRNEVWRIGIERPETALKSDLFSSIIELNNMSLSTSGSYRKFFLDESGQKRSHILNPTTGKPVEHSLLSVSIIASKSVIADALATYCMVIGPEKSKKFIEDNNDIVGQIIYEKDNKLVIWQSKGFKKYLSKSTK